MLYLALALIFLGVLIFVYSILVDARRRHGDSGMTAAYPPEEFTETAKGPPSATGPGPVAGRPKVAPERAQAPRPMADARAPGRVRPAPAVDSPVKGEAPGRAVSSRRVSPSPPGRSEPMAVLYEDSSRVIDYDSGSGIIDPSLEGYRKIRRIARGRFAVEKSGITFRTESTLYRFDFHRLRDIREGSRHLALFLGGSESVRLFIFDTEHAAIRAAAAAYRDYKMSPA